MARKMILKGVGRFMARKTVNGVPTNEVLDCGTLQGLKFDFNVELDDIFGGDGMFAIDQILKTKGVNITATEAKFDLNMIALLMGSTTREAQATTLWVMGEQLTPAGAKMGTSPDNNAAKIILKNPATKFAGAGLTIKGKLDNTLLTKMEYSATTPPDAGKFMVNTAGSTVEVYMPLAMLTQDVVVNYEINATGVDVLDILVDEVPFPVSIVHQGSFIQKDGTKQGVQVELYSCIASGSMSMDMQRRSASSHEIQLKVIDPERADGKLGDIKRFTAA